MQLPEHRSKKLMTAAYSAILGREPDKTGLDTYAKHFREVSIAQSTERAVRALLKSMEFKKKHA